MINGETITGKEKNFLEEGDIILPLQPKKRKKKCSMCGKILLPDIDKSFTKGGKTYCEECYNLYIISNVSDIKEQNDKEQKEKKLFWDFVRMCYNIEDIPDWWVSQVEKMIKEGKKWGAMRYTLWYIKNIRCLPFCADYGLSIIKNNYQSASEYYTKMKKIISYNKTVPLSKPVINKVKVDSPSEEKQKSKINMEDL